MKTKKHRKKSNTKKQIKIKRNAQKSKHVISNNVKKNKIKNNEKYNKSYYLKRKQFCFLWFVICKQQQTAQKQFDPLKLNHSQNKPVPETNKKKKEKNRIKIVPFTKHDVITKKT